MKEQSKPITNFFKSLIPGIILAAVVFGPSKMTITTKLGAEYGYALEWIVLVAVFFMAIFTGMGSRIGSSSTKSLLSLIKEKFGKFFSVTIGVGIFLVAASFQAGNSIGVGISIAESTGTSPKLWVIVFTLLGILLLSFRSFYKTLEKLMLILVGLMLLSFVATFFLARPDFNQIIGGFKPSLPVGSTGLVIAFMASCFSIVGAFYQSYLVRERAKINGSNSKDNSLTGVMLLGVMSLVVMICGAAILKPKGIEVKSALDMAGALEPLFGSYASVMFLTGLFGASFSSVVGNATLGGTLLGDGLGYGSDLSSKTIRIFIALVMVIGAIVAIVFGKLPLELIVMAQSVTIFLVPFIGFAMYAIANDEKIMGNKKNSPFVKISGGIGLILVVFLAISNAYDIFIK
ncbi:Nramp family divalent metal transporter [Pseudopedobacter beijingensis]|uniref:Nramp family divalent metal transporter n=1 Tax=Pseudopedobacter beijingensis TaxID=1207056 RepID=A0ABW4I7Q8_9SPHI